MNTYIHYPYYFILKAPSTTKHYCHKKDQE